MNHFRIGDNVIYPNQGIGVIEDIKIEKHYGQEFKIYHVRIISNNTLVLVPSTSAQEIGIRKPIQESRIEEISSFIRNGYVDITMNWKGRYKEHINLMKSGSILNMVVVLKSLYYLNLIKPLSFREKKMMEKAKELIVTEISIVSSVPIKETEKRVLETLSLSFEDVPSRLDS